jgi:hypothetical protein
MARNLFFLLVFLAGSLASGAQIREIPKNVKSAFEAQYPQADSSDYKDNLMAVNVHFRLNGDRMVATYSNKGKWKETEKDWSFDSLSTEIKDGFAKSKYSEWKVSETKVVYRPSAPELFKVRVEKGDLQKRNLYFNAAGRLVEDLYTLY